MPLHINHNWSQQTSMEMVGLTNSKRHSPQSPQNRTTLRKYLLLLHSLLPKSPLLYKRKESDPHQKQYQSCLGSSHPSTKLSRANEHSEGPPTFWPWHNKKNGPLRNNQTIAICNQISKGAEYRPSPIHKDGRPSSREQDLIGVFSRKATNVDW